MLSGIWGKLKMAIQGTGMDTSPEVVQLKHFGQGLDCRTRSQMTNQSYPCSSQSIPATPSHNNFWIGAKCCFKKGVWIPLMQPYLKNFAEMTIIWPYRQHGFLPVCNPQ